MSLPIANGVEENISDARERLIPPTLYADSQSATPLLTLKHFPSTGYGVFASKSFEADTCLLQSDEPAVYVTYRPFRKEVCAWCFRYEQGRNWKVRFVSDAGCGSGVVAGIVFCSERCRDAWKDRYGDVAVQAYASVEGLVFKQAKNKGWTIEPYPMENNDKVPNQEQIEKAWANVEEQANLILSLRGENPHRIPPSEPQNLEYLNSKSKLPSKLLKQALAKAAALPILNTDILFFLLSGILCASTSISSNSPWRTLLTLNPSPHALYPTPDALRQMTSTFLHLIAVLPPSLLPFVSRETLEAILARDIGNSFGIWSTSAIDNFGTCDNLDAHVPNVQRMYAEQEGAEMLGYGIWPVASFFNHSCVPNVSRFRIGRNWVFSSARDVAEGEELCISYIRGEEDVLNLEERRNRLKDAWGFTCRCAKCLHEEEIEGT